MRRTVLSPWFEVGGVVLVAVGCGLIYMPAGLIVAGIALTWLGYRIGG